MRPSSTFLISARFLLRSVVKEGDGSDIKRLKTKVELNRFTNLIHLAMVGGCRRTIRFSSVYLPYVDPKPRYAMLRDIVQHSAEEKKEIILGIDTNAHHIFVREHGHQFTG